MALVCSPSTNMEDFSFFLETEYGSISFQYKDGGFSLYFKDGFRLQDYCNDNPPKPTEDAPPSPEIKEGFQSLNFEETSPSRTKAKLENLQWKSICNPSIDIRRRSPMIKRCNFPKKTTAILKEWLLQNCQHPYPSEKEKGQLAEATNLSLRQVNDWMINARRRYLKIKNTKKCFGTKSI